MPRPTRDLTGQTLGRLTVLSKADPGKGRTRWNCRCECGTELIVYADQMLSGNTLSCGCLRVDTTIARATTHGYSKGKQNRTYRIWAGMLTRCNNPNRPKYKDYGGRGIKVSPRWHSYQNFLRDMGECPEGLTLERKDTNKNYEPGNCEWADYKTQQNNRRNNRRIIVNDTCIFNIGEVEELVGLNRHTISRRIEADQPIIIGDKVFRLRNFEERYV